MTTHNLFEQMADVTGQHHAGILPTLQPPVTQRPRPRTPGTRAEQEAAWDALARAMGWPLHRSDVPVDSDTRITPEWPWQPKHVREQDVA